MSEVDGADDEIMLLRKPLPTASFIINQASDIRNKPMRRHAQCSAVHTHTMNITEMHLSWMMNHMRAYNKQHDYRDAF